MFLALLSSKLVTAFTENFMFGLQGPNNIIFLFKFALLIVSGNCHDLLEMQYLNLSQYLK